MAEPCAGCNLIETQAIKHGRHYYCPTCPNLPKDKQKPADPVRAGLGDLLKRKPDA